MIPKTSLPMHIQRPANDAADYKYITLANGLRVLLIHDQSASRSSAAMAVQCGHFCDPADRQGLAHLLEHMLFLGTEDYPVSGEYQTFINQHGGHHNAWTGTEHSNYFFDITTPVFGEALHRFSRFFVNPLFDATLIDQEKQAIDAEYRTKINDDMRRSLQVHKETINPAHPFHQFSVGNLVTFATTPEQSLHQELLDFFRKHYTASRMNLVCLSSWSISKLEQTVIQFFQDIQGEPAAITPPSMHHIPLYRDDDLKIRIAIKPLREIRRLSLTFALPNMDAAYRTKPLAYISHLIGFEGKGSLLSYLKKKGWISGLSAGQGLTGDNFVDFQIHLSLTPDGLAQEETIIEHVFQFLALIREQGLDSWRFTEKSALLQVMYESLEATRPIEKTAHLAMNQFYYPPEEVLHGDYLMDQYDPILIRQCLDYLVPDRLRLTIIAPEVETNRVAEWYFTDYMVTAIDSARLNVWRKQGLPDQNRYSLPLPNPFLPDRFEARSFAEQTTNPKSLVNRPGIRVWHQPDSSFAVPKANLFIAVDSGYAVISPEHSAMLRLFIEVLLDQLNEYTYQAEIAGLHYNIYAHQGGFTIQLSGFSCRLYSLLELILNHRKAGMPAEHRFFAIRDQLIRHWNNQDKNKPIAQLFSQLTSLLQPNNPPVKALIPYLEKASPTMMPDYVRRLFKAVHLEILAQGDITEEEVRQIVGLLDHHLTPNSLPSRETKRKLVDIRGLGTGLYAYHCPHPDSAVIIYYQSPSKDAASAAMYLLANHIMSSSFFHDLRTEQQLGYMVGTSNLQLNRHPGLVFYIQSSVMSPEGLTAAIDHFIDEFHLQLMGMNEQTWQDNKIALMHQCEEEDTNQRSRSLRLWNAIGNRDFSFQFQKRVAHQLNEIAKPEFMRFIRSLRSSHADRLVLYSQGRSQPDTEHPLTGHQIHELSDFQHHFAQFYSI